jgi:hypothetical protein
MKSRSILSALLVASLLALSMVAGGAPRDDQWAGVAEAVRHKQPKTALGLLKAIETSAFADQAWGEGSKALLMRVRLANGLWFAADPFPVSGKPRVADDEEVDPFADQVEDPFEEPEVFGDAELAGLPGCVKMLDTEIPAAPPQVRPILRWFQARWLTAYLEDRYSSIRYDRQDRTDASGGDIETWGFTRFYSEIDHIYQKQLAEKDVLRKTPVAVFREVLGAPGALGDSLRPTLYDLVCHSALGHYTGTVETEKWLDDPLRVSAADPALGTTDEFLAWQPAPVDGLSPRSRALKIYQELLAFHRGDAQRDAFLHCDLERIRWAATVTGGAGKPERHAAAIRGFIAANAAHPLSADARQDDVVLWMQRDKLKEAHASALAGAEAFPGHPFGKVCRGIVARLEARELSIRTPSTWPLGGDVVTVSHLNLSHAWFRLYRRDWKPDRETLADDIELKKDEVEAILKEQPLRSWDAPLPDPRDYRMRSTEVATPADLEPGYHVLVISATEAFTGKDAVVAWTGVHISKFGLSIDSIRGDARRIGGLVFDPVSGAPLADVKVEILLGGNKDKGLESHELRTGADGSFEMRPPVSENGLKYLAMAGDGVDRAVCRNTAWSHSERQERTVTVTFFTDRKIYRPGQTIHFKGICCDADRADGKYRTVDGKPVKVTLYGANQQKVGELDLVTNAYGSFAGSFTAPAQSLLGEFVISAAELGSTRIRVEEYKRPTFTVELQAPVKPVKIGGTVEMKGIAKAYTGAPVDGAEVEWSVERYAFWTGWGAWRNWNDLGLDSFELATGKAVTAADGTFTISFVAAPDEMLDPAMGTVFGFDVTATVTDQAGETSDDYREVSVGYSDFTAELEAGEWQEVGKPVVFEVRTQTHDGNSHPAAGTLRIHKVKEPGICPREFEEIEVESPVATDPVPGPQGWEMGEVIAEVAVRTELSKDGEECLAEVPVSLAAGMYRAVFEAKDSGDHKVVAIAGLQVVDPKADRFTTRIPFHSGAPTWSCEPGEPVTLLWGSGFENARVCVEWYKDGTLLKREWSAAGRTQQVFSFTPDESLRGGFSVRLLQFSMNRLHSEFHRISVPWTNKDLKLRWEHITSKLQPGARDVWTAVVSGPDGAAAVAEMVATLYDASLDDLSWHSFDDFRSLFRTGSWYVGGCKASSYLTFAHHDSGDLADYWGQVDQPFRRPNPALDESLEFIGIGVNEAGRVGIINEYRDITLLGTDVWDFYEPPELPNSVGSSVGMGSAFPMTPATPAGRSPLTPEGIAEFEKRRQELAAIPVRQKLQETAFFYPQLTSGADGEVRISFTMPEGLGKWRFLGFAHDAAMRFGSLEGETITSKDLMVQPNPPRFLREGDVLDFTVRVTNQSDREQSGAARLSLMDATTDEDRSALLEEAPPDQPFRIPARQSRTLSWRLNVPDGTGFLRYKALATCGELTDGEEGWLPVLPRRIRVTDSLMLPLRDAGSKSHTFARLGESAKSDTLKHQFLDVQVVSRPEWHAVMAMPYLMEFPHECSEQTFSRYYANALAAHLVKSDPAIRRVFESWRGTDALDSPLMKNEDIKNIMIEQTPWLQDAAGESQARRRMALLFDENHLRQQIAGTLEKLRGMQDDGGLWPWFRGGNGSEFISLHIVAGFGRLRALGVETDVSPALKSLAALDGVLTEKHRLIRKAAVDDPLVPGRNHLDPWVAHHLYTRSFFLNDKAVAQSDQAARDYFLGQAKQYWPQLRSRLATAQVALALQRSGDAETARLITRSLRETARNDPESGMSWPAGQGDGWSWWQAPVESQALIIEAFREIDNDWKAVEDCKVWLIRQKQVRQWDSTKATVDAIQALLGNQPDGGTDVTADPLLRISLGGEEVRPAVVEAGTGFYEHRFSGAEVKPEMAEITLTKSDPGIAWAGVHWQYFEDLGKLGAHESASLKLEKSLFVRRSSDKGLKLEAVSGPVRVGDELVTRIVLRNDRAMDFLHLQDSRGSGTEPLNVLSGYRWRDGFACYEVTRDTASHFFIDHLPAGTHVFETSVRVQHAGVYQSGIAEIRCMYAPEFHARSGSVKLDVVRTSDRPGQ